MPYLKPFILLTLTISTLQSVSAQESSPDRELRKYLKTIQIAKVDTFLVIKAGCTGCQVEYEDSLKSVNDGKTIYVLTQDKGKFKVAIFDDFHKKIIEIDTCSLFEVITQNKSTLQQKDTFYKKEVAILNDSKFIPPRPSHYNFEQLIIQLPNFKYNFMIVGNDADDMGFIQSNKKWFVATKKIIDTFYALLSQ